MKGRSKSKDPQLEARLLHQEYLRLERLTKEACAQMLDSKTAFEDLTQQRNEAWERFQLFKVSQERKKP